MIYSGYFCDKCGEAVEFRRQVEEGKIPSKTIMISHARMSGWSVGKKILCPECRKRK